MGSCVIETYKWARSEQADFEVSMKTVRWPLIICILESIAEVEGQSLVYSL